MSGYEQIDELFRSIESNIAKCQQLDEAEYDSAVRALDGCGERRSISDAIMRERLSFPVEMLTFIRDRCDKYYREGFAAPEELADKSERWADLAQRIEELRSRASAITIDSWQGAAADNYRARIPQFCDDLAGMTELAKATVSGIGAASDIVKRENEKMDGAVKAADDAVSVAAKKNPEPRTDWPDAAWWKRWNADWANREQYSFEFFSRCAEAGHALYRCAETLVGWISQFDPNSPAARDLADSINRLGGRVQANGIGVCASGPRDTSAEGDAGSKMS